MADTQPLAPTDAELLAAHDMGAKGSLATDRERLLFEAWMRGHCWALSAQWDGSCYRGSAEHGGYVCPRAMNTRQLWAAWRDRAALAAAPQPVVREPLTDEQIREMWHDSRPNRFEAVSFARAIERAHGIPKGNQ